METDEQNAAESSTAQETDVTTESSPVPIESWTSAQRDKWLETGKVPEGKTPTTEASAPSPDASETRPASETGKTKEAPKPKGAAERKQELAQEIQDLLRQRADLRQEVAAGKTGETKTAPPAERPEAVKTTKLEKPVAPKAADFDTWEKYEQALAEYPEKLTDYKLAMARAEQVEATEQAKVAEANRVIEQGWKTKVAQFTIGHADFAEVGLSKELPINATMDGFILDSPIGPAILYHLGSDLNEARRIAALGPYATARELTRIEDSLSGKTQASTIKTTKAPRPPTELGGKNTAPEDDAAAALAAGDFTRYTRLMNARDKKG